MSAIRNRLTAATTRAQAMTLLGAGEITVKQYIRWAERQEQHTRK
jgi:hypothetical protein